MSVVVRRVADIELPYPPTEDTPKRLLQALVDDAPLGERFAGVVGEPEHVGPGQTAEGEPCYRMKVTYVTEPGVDDV